MGCDPVIISRVLCIHLLLKQLFVTIFYDSIESYLTCNLHGIARSPNLRPYLPIRHIGILPLAIFLQYRLSLVALHDFISGLDRQVRSLRLMTHLLDLHFIKVASRELSVVWFANILADYLSVVSISEFLLELR